MPYESPKHILSLVLADIPPRVLQIVFITCLSLKLNGADFARYGQLIAYTSTLSLFLSFGLTTLFPLDYNKDAKNLLNPSKVRNKYAAYILFVAFLCIILFLSFFYSLYREFPAFLSNILLVAAFAASRAITAIVLTINRLTSSWKLLIFVSYISKLPALLFPLLVLYSSSYLSFANFSVEAIVAIEILSVLIFLPFALSSLCPGRATSCYYIFEPSIIFCLTINMLEF